MNARLWTRLLPVAAAALAGCGTIKTTVYDHDKQTGIREPKKCFKGIPITLEVPILLRLEVVETHYYTKGKKTIREQAINENGKVFAKDALADTYLPLAHRLPSRGLDYRFITLKELYTVDFKRPAAGIIDLKLDFEEGNAANPQYFKSITQDVTDLTIEKVAALVQTAATVVPQLAKAASDPPPPNANIVAVPHTVVWLVFDRREPGIEARVQQFLDCYLNCAQPCPDSNCPTSCPVPPTGDVVPVAATDIKK